MNRWFAEQFHRHPSMQGPDLIKLCYQSFYGAEHLLTDISAAKVMFDNEFAATPADSGPLWERIGKDFCRVNLGAWKARGLDPDILFDLFRKSAETASPDRNEDAIRSILTDTLATATQCMPEDRLPEIRKTLDVWLSGPMGAVHHSDAYRKAESPAYRLVSRPLLQEVVPTSENYIWDLDGTLLDSYAAIVSCLVSAASDMGQQVDPNEVLTVCKRFTVGHYARQFSETYGGTAEQMITLYHRYSEVRSHLITEIPGAKDILRTLAEDGAAHFVFTARGNTTFPVLDQLGMTGFFQEIVTSLNGFPHKPAPDGVLYLMRKYGMDPEHTYYVGDRELDANCAFNAGIRSLQLLEEGTCVPPTGHEDVVVRRLADLHP